MTQIGQLEAKPERQSQTNEQINKLESNLIKLHDRIGTLTDRLSIVLRSSVPGEQPSESKDRAELVQFAITIESFVDSVQSANYKIEDLLDRLEL